MLFYLMTILAHEYDIIIYFTIRELDHNKYFLWVKFDLQKICIHFNGHR